MIVDKLTEHFRSTPATHKLGVLFVVDSVTRQWMEKAKQAGQGSAAAMSSDSPYVAGVDRMSKIVASFVGETVSQAPVDQKVCCVSW